MASITCDTQECVFRATWTPIPGEAGHRFQSKLDSDST